MVVYQFLQGEARFAELARASPRGQSTSLRQTDRREACDTLVNASPISGGVAQDGRVPVSHGRESMPGHFKGLSTVNLMGTFLRSHACFASQNTPATPNLKTQYPAAASSKASRFLLNVRGSPNSKEPTINPRHSENSLQCAGSFGSRDREGDCPATTPSTHALKKAARVSADAPDYDPENARGNDQDYGRH